ncbi:four helix bundle protein [Marivirga lumbricoides]|uniref:Four helix bundle protein n=1 Tax=Marivirga lumbricoides TaxID=1046115 RepID=A0A2T4DJK6_9BACT|nr:four helix bundle protein [Marivirga lumbricoides]
MHNYKELKIWSLTIKLAEEVYVLTQKFPDEEKFGLKSQMRRCAVSIPSNIAEGAGRNGQKEFKQFLGIALGSLFELDTQVELSYSFKYISEEDYNSMQESITQIRRMTYSFQQKLI